MRTDFLLEAPGRPGLSVEQLEEYLKARRAYMSNPNDNPNHFQFDCEVEHKIVQMRMSDELKKHNLKKRYGKNGIDSTPDTLTSYLNSTPEYIVKTGKEKVPNAELKLIGAEVDEVSSSPTIRWVYIEVPK